MIKIKKVYIASPYTLGDTAANVSKQIRVAETLIGFGLCPFVPLMSHFHQMFFPHTFEEWIEIDLVWVKSCDAVLRLDGKSTGADMEVKCAIENNIPVFYSVDELWQYISNYEEE